MSRDRAEVLLLQQVRDRPMLETVELISQLFKDKLLNETEYTHLMHTCFVGDCVFFWMEEGTLNQLADRLLKEIKMSEKEDFTAKAEAYLLAAAGRGIEEWLKTKDGQALCPGATVRFDDTDVLIVENDTMITHVHMYRKEPA